MTVTLSVLGRGSLLGWSKGIVEWAEGDTACVSVPFSWLLPAAASRCAWLKAEGYRVRAGGPAVSMRPSYLVDFAEIGGSVEALSRHNPDATFTSRGCIRQCPFCIVPQAEGMLVELPRWEPRPIVCDNNLLACSRKHFDRVIDSLKPLSGIDFNQGLDARLLTVTHAERIAELDMLCVRLAWDHTDDEIYVTAAIEMLQRAGFPIRAIRVYVLIGYEESPDDALYRLEILRAKGIRPNVMRYQPPWILKRNEYVAPQWTGDELLRFSKYWNRLRWLEHIPFTEFRVSSQPGGWNRDDSIPEN